MTAKEKAPVDAGARGETRERFTPANSVSQSQRITDENNWLALFVAIVSPHRPSIEKSLRLFGGYGKKRAYNRRATV